MPLKRTPPSTPQEKSDINRSSVPVKDTDKESCSNASSRPRARKRQHDDDITAAISEMKKCLEAFKTQQNSIQASIDGIIKQNSELIKSIEFMSQQYEDMKGTLIKMETEKRSHLAYIQALETKVENLERTQKQTCIEIRNIPSRKNETKDDLLTLIQRVGSITQTCISESHVRDIFRLSADKKGGRAILVDFSSVLLKEKILSSIKTHNRKNQASKLNTALLQLDGQPQPIFIVESLTQKARKLFYLAREFASKNNYEFCWTAHGRVFLRQKVGAPSHRIDKESDFDKLQPPYDK